MKKHLLLTTCLCIALACVSNNVWAEELPSTTVITDTQEVSPFGDKIETVKTTTTKINIDDIEPAILEDIQPEIKKITTEEQSYSKVTAPNGNVTNIKTETVDKIDVDKNTTETVTTTQARANDGSTSSKTTSSDKVIVKPDKTTQVHIEETKTIEGTTLKTQKTTTKIETTSVELGDKPKEQVKTDEEGKVVPVLPDLEKIDIPEPIKTHLKNEPVRVEVSSQRIPAGTQMPIKIDSPVNSVVSELGDQFNASLTSDIMINDNVILPSGSVVRGTIGKVRHASMCLREGRVMLVFDHVVTPVGKQVPLNAYISNTPNVNYEGYLVGNSSYGMQFKKDAEKSGKIITDTTKWGVDKGLSFWKGIPVIITAPVSAIGGVLGGGGYIIGMSVADVIKTGKPDLIEPGTKMNITLVRPLDIPVN